MKRQKLVLLINSLSGGGAEKVLLALSDEMGRNYETEIVTLNNDCDYDSQGMNIHYLSDKKSPSKSILKVLSLLKAGFLFSKYIKRHHQTTIIVQSHLFQSNYINILAKLFGARHLSILVNAVAFSSKYSGKSFNSIIHYSLVSILYRYSDQLIFKSHAMRADYIKRFSSISKGKVIHNPIDMEEIRSLSCDNESMNLSEKKNNRYIISMGRFHPQKRQIDLVKAFLKIRDKYQEVELLFLGKGETQQKIRDYCIKHEVHEKIHFLGWKKNPYKYIRRSFLYVSTSESEGFPNALLESLACGTPVISTDCLSGPREILAQNFRPNDIPKDNIDYAKYGILIPVKSVDLLAQALDAMLENKNNIYDYYANNTYSNLKKYDQKIIAQQYIITIRDMFS